MIVRDALKGVQSLYVETSPLIYFIEQYPGYVDRMREVFQLILKQEIEIFTSTLTLTETLTKPIKSGDRELQKQYQELFLKTRHLTLTPLNVAVANRAAALRAQYNLKTPDAVQVASALETKCDAFLTNDLGIKRVAQIRIIVLDELVVESL